MTVTIISLSRPEVFGQLVAIQSVYEAMYAMPSGSADEYRPILIEHSQREGYRLCAALDQESDQIIGFGYGFTGGPGQTWRDDLAKAVGAEVAAEWLTGHFEFAEFGVIPSMRRQGIGTLLYEALFSRLRHDRAVLTVREENEPARGFYDKQEWEVLYEGFFAQSGRGPYIIMGKILNEVRGQ